MDNFIDRITHRFSGHEGIKANSEAEAAEMRKLKSHAEHANKTLAQHDAFMQEMRKLNLRNAESAKEVQDLIEHAKTILQAMRDVGFAEKEDPTDEVITGISDRIAGLSNKLADSDRKIAAISEKIDGTDGKVSAITAKIDGTDGKVSAITEKIDGTDGKVTAITEKVDGTDGKVTEITAKIDETDGRIAALTEKINSTNDKIGELAEKINALEKSSDSDLKADLENAVHKENVKVYRNIQAVLMEEISKQTDMFSESFTKVKGFNKVILILVIVSLLAGLGGIGISIAQIFGVF